MWLGPILKGLIVIIVLLLKVGCHAANGDLSKGIFHLSGFLVLCSAEAIVKLHIDFLHTFSKRSNFCWKYYTYMWIYKVKYMSSNKVTYDFLSIKGLALQTACQTPMVVSHWNWRLDVRKLLVYESVSTIYLQLFRYIHTDAHIEIQTKTGLYCGEASSLPYRYSISFTITFIHW